MHVTLHQNYLVFLGHRFHLSASRAFLIEHYSACYYSTLLMYLSISFRRDKGEKRREKRGKSNIFVVRGARASWWQMGVLGGWREKLRCRAHPTLLDTSDVIHISLYFCVALC